MSRPDDRSHRGRLSLDHGTRTVPDGAALSIAGPRQCRPEGGTRVGDDSGGSGPSGRSFRVLRDSQPRQRSDHMGLDMYAYSLTKEPETDTDFAIDDDALLIHQWRKHPNLHGWMEQLYLDRGGEQSFNCTPVRLTEADINRLEAAIRAGALPPTCGFFFGQSDGSEIEDDLAFIAKARKALAAGFFVVYSSWW